MSHSQGTTRQSKMMKTSQNLAIEVKHVSISFGKREILHDISWQIPYGAITTLIGPNGCGKSTLLKALVGYNDKHSGSIHIGGNPLSSYSHGDLARHVAFLPQTPDTPKDMLVEELVACGRFPYQKWWKNTFAEDQAVVNHVLEVTKTSHLRKQAVSSLSGGERQRVWIAMALAQEPKILVLDEPTTYLDINHQFEIMELLQQLNQEEGMTVLMVLHELSQAARYSHEIGVIHKRQLVVHGRPKEVMTKELLKDVFSVDGVVEEEAGHLQVKIYGLLK